MIMIAALLFLASVSALANADECAASKREIGDGSCKGTVMGKSKDWHGDRSQTKFLGIYSSCKELSDQAFGHEDGFDLVAEDMANMDWKYQDLVRALQYCSLPLIPREYIELTPDQPGSDGDRPADQELTDTEVEALRAYASVSLARRNLGYCVQAKAEKVAELQRLVEKLEQDTEDALNIAEQLLSTGYMGIDGSSARDRLESRVQKNEQMMRDRSNNNADIYCSISLEFFSS